MEKHIKKKIKKSNVWETHTTVDTFVYVYAVSSVK